MSNTITDKRVQELLDTGRVDKLSLEPLADPAARWQASVLVGGGEGITMVFINRPTFDEAHEAIMQAVRNQERYSE